MFPKHQLLRVEMQLPWSAEIAEQLVRTQPDETPTIYEMGIPVAALE